MADTIMKQTVLKSWTWLIIMIVIILAIGLLAFFVVTDKGQPTWDYRPVKDLPASSSYADYEKLPFPQHIKGQGGK